MKIEKVAIFAGPDKNKVKDTLAQMEEFFSSKKIESQVVFLSHSSSDYSIKSPECDLAVSLGGDGTVLTAAVILKDANIPVLAVKMGTFGYISDVALSEFQQAFNDYENNLVSVSRRTLLNIHVNRSGKTVFSSVALNEATVAVSSKIELGKMTVFINNTLAANLKADGIIIATPTGSTAYSLSAGGPILEPDQKSLIVNPICPFSMSVRPLVVNDTSVIKVEIPKQNASFIIASDGHETFNLKSGDTIEISKYKNEVPFVLNNCRNFIETLRNKLGWAGEFNA